MSSSDPVPGRLVVRSPGAVLDVLDSWLEPLPDSGTVGELSLEVAPGTYQISARIGAREKIQLVVVRSGEPIEIDIPVEFDAAAPVEGTTTANEAHGDLAHDLTGPTLGRSATAASWRSSSLVLILRRLLDQEPAPLPNTHAPFDLFDQHGRPVYLPTPTLARQVSDRIPPAVGWAVPLRPGGYRLRWVGPSGQPVEHAVWLSSGWQTLLFVPQDARGPYLPEMSVHLLKTGRSWDRHSPGWLAVEAAFAALRESAAPAVDPRSADFVADADNPMLALLTLHSLGRARRAGVLGTALDQDLTKRAEGGIRQLRRSLGWHPDVAALAELWSTGSDDRRRVSSTPWPPLLADSLDLLLAAEGRRPKIIPALRVVPSRSLTEVVGGQRYASSPWLLWDPKGLPVEPAARQSPRSRARSERSPTRADGVRAGTPAERRRRMQEKVQRWVRRWAEWWRAHRPWERPLRVYRTAGRRATPSGTITPVAVERVRDLVGGVAHVLQISSGEAAKRRLGTHVIAHRLGMADRLANLAVEQGGLMAVKWPAANDNLLGPTQELLRGLAVLEDEQAGAGANEHENSFNPFSAATTPYSLQVITAGTLAFSQQAAKIVTGLGGAAAILAAIKGIWFSSGSAEQVAFIGGAAVVLAALFVSLAIIVRSDVLARSRAQAAEYAAREHIASTFLQAAERAQANLTARTGKYWLRTTTAQGWQAIDHFEVGGNGLVAVLGDAAHTTVPCGDITLLTYASQVS
jgi:hypothetical protein